MLTVCTVLGKICNSCKFMTNEERSLNKYTKNSNCRILEVGSISSQAMIVQFVLSLAVLSAVEQATGTDVLDIHMKSQEKLASQAKGRISLQNTAEIQHCLLAAGDVGCAVFECFENNSCEINGLQQICMTFLHNAGKFNSQGKSFIKDALKCMAHGLRHKFSCISRKCLAVKDMVLQLQRECYVKHNLCSAAKENVNVMVQMIHFQDLFSKGPYVELVNILLGCGELVKEAITRSVRLQCEQNWGALCESLSFCSLGQPEPQTPPTPTPEHLRHTRDSQRQPHPSGTHSKRSVAPWQGDRAKVGRVGFPRTPNLGKGHSSPEAARQAAAEHKDFRR